MIFGTPKPRTPPVFSSKIKNYIDSVTGRDDYMTLFTKMIEEAIESEDLDLLDEIPKKTFDLFIILSYKIGFDAKESVEASRIFIKGKLYHAIATEDVENFKFIERFDSQYIGKLSMENLVKEVISILEEQGRL